MTRDSRTVVALTKRAIQDLRDIFNFSTERWGKKVADKYLDEMEAGLNLLREHPDLLAKNQDFHGFLSFYRIQKQLLVCDTREGSIVILTVIHTSMDIESHLAELTPTLSREVNILHEKLRKAQGKKPGDIRS